MRCHFPNAPQSYAGSVGKPALSISGMNTSLVSRRTVFSPMPVRNAYRLVMIAARLGLHFGWAYAASNLTPPAASASSVGVGGVWTPWS